MTDGLPALLECDCPELRPGWLARSLSTLVRCPSVNPGTSERALAELCAAQLADTPCELEFVEFAPGRTSLAAVLRGRNNGPRLVLNGHLDTVPVGEESLWRVGPFDGSVRDGAVWGRGACDMKGGLVAHIACARVLSRKVDRLHGTLVLHFAAGEESGEPGTLSLLERGYAGDYGIVGEPTGLNVAIAARGVVWLRVSIHGQASHAARAQRQSNPLNAAPTVLEALSRYDSSLSAISHPLLGSPACTPTAVHAGGQHNATPSECALVFDRRLVPGEAPGQALEDVRRALRSAEDAYPQLTFSVEPIHNAFEPAEVSKDSPVAQHLVAALTGIKGARPELYGTPFSSDVRNLINDAGMDAVTFGAGDIGVCHQPDEHILIDDLRTATHALCLTALGILT